MQILQNREIYEQVVKNGILTAEKYLWIATANLKDLHVKNGKKYISILNRFAEMANQGVSIRIIHAAEPSGPFRESFDKHRELIRGDVEFLHCPRLHFKTVIIDGKKAYSGSANFTGAGLGAKSENRRNFETGFLFTEKEQIRELAGIFDGLWMGRHCTKCGRRNVCPDPIE